MTTGFQVPGLGQAHKVCSGVKHVNECSTLLLPYTPSVVLESNMRTSKQRNKNTPIEKNNNKGSHIKRQGQLFGAISFEVFP